MNRKVVALLLVVLSSIAQANPISLCDSYGKLAEAIMRARQNGATPTQLLKLAEARDAQLANAIIMEAFEVPRFATANYQNATVAEFRSKVEFACLRSRGI